MTGDESNTAASGWMSRAVLARASGLRKTLVTRFIPGTDTPPATPHAGELIGDHAAATIRSMDGNDPLPPGSAPQQWPPPYPVAAAPQTRRWMPPAIVGAAIIIAGALVGGAVIISNNNTNSGAIAAGGQPAAETTAAGISTCQAWTTTRAALDQIPPLPRGWDWNTPNIDTLIANKNAATDAILEQFTPEIAPNPANVAAVANEYVEAKRREAAMLTEHTFSAADAAVGNAVVGRLNNLCGVTD